MATIQGSCSLNPTKYSYYAEWSESNINVANNTSDVTVNVYVQKIGNYNSEGSNNSNTLYIGGTPYTTSGLYIDMNPETTPRLVASGTKTVTHNADGSKSITISCSGSLPYGNGYGPQSGSLSATVSLTTIPREAYVTNSVNFTLGNNIPLTLSNAGNFYVQSLLYVNSTLIKTTNHGRVTSATITPTSGEVDSMYAQIPNATSCAMYVRIKTYSDSGYTSQIGSNKDKTGTMSINQTTNKPTFTDFAVANLDKNVANTDKYSNVLVTSSTSTLLGSDAKVIKGYSKLRATVSVANKMVALNSATAVKYRFSAGSLTKDENYSAVADVTLDIDNVLTKDVSVTAYDSRNLTTSVSKSLSYLAEYTPVSLWGLAFVRDNSVDSKTKLQVSGSFWKQYFGGGTSGVLNSVTAHYRYKLTTESWASQTWTAITLTDDGSGNLSFDDYIEGDLGASGFDSDKSFDIEVRLYDKLSNVIVEATLSRGIPVMDITQDGVAFGGMYDSTEGGVLQILAKNILNIMYPVGSIYTNASNSTNPATLMGFGTWEAFGQGRVMVGKATSGTFATAGATMGAETHTLTTDEIPSHSHESPYDRHVNTTITLNSSGVNIVPKVSTNGSFAGYSVRATGGGGSHNNIQPSIVVYMWKRTA